MQTVTTNKTTLKYLTIIAKGIISEQEIISMRSFMNSNKDAAREIFNVWNDNELAISQEQGQKGYDFLMDQWKSKTGRERKNNPFGYREQAILENFSHFTLKSLYDNSKYGQSAYYLPLYSCTAKDGNSFEYYYDGEVHIIG